MKLTKIFGWALLIGGIAIIFWSLYCSYQIFSGKKEPPEVFSIEKKVTQISSKQKTPTSQGEIQKEMEKIIGEKIKEIFPEDVVFKTFNLISWSVFSGIVIFAGSQISNLGIKMIKG